MTKKIDLYNATKKILKEVRFGNLSSRLNADLFPEDADFINDFNSMLETINDREKMIFEYKNFILDQSEYLKNLFNMLNEGAMTISENFEILSINDTLSKWFRKTKKNLVGISLFKILKKYTIKEYPSNKIINDYEAFFEKNIKNYNLTFEFKKNKMTFSVSIKKFLAKDNKPNYFIVTKDITSDVNLQKLKDTFMATLTHDLKVPILAESKVLSLLLKESFGSNTEAQQQAFLNMQANNTDMMTLVQTLLDTHKLDDSAYEIHPEFFDIKKLIEEESEKLKFLAEENLCTIKTKFKSKLPKLYADRKEIARVLRNLLTNAINFAPENSAVTASVTTDNEYFYIAITDCGTGIDAESIPLIFDRYYSTAKQYRKVGTGLGLYLSKKIINLHKGDILVESIANKKTTFTIKLPIN